ncbi:hypothetical protein [Rhodothermus profundi]|uniref:Uncharacterized protein n=1 Tax=Rhodothermus profundi TaxID=633813 RepID=A0A1M6VV94_9BACT|nr:hypothetical protein [Rhodothermus profundi]SHK85462.1 hypothetical protein SAMN04488087_2130 [Rhodothermus profundi]
MRAGLLVLSGVLLGISVPLYYQQLRPDPWRLLWSGEERQALLLVYIGSPTCGPSNDPALPALLAAMRRHLERVAVERGIAFRMVGVAISRDIRRGLQHLEKMGAFHEVAVGAAGRI